MRKAIKFAWAVFLIAILTFVVSVVWGANTVGSDAMMWRIFSITMPVAGVSFWGAIILTIIYYTRAKK